MSLDENRWLQRLSLERFLREFVDPGSEIFREDVLEDLVNDLDFALDTGLGFIFLDQQEMDLARSFMDQLDSALRSGNARMIGYSTGFEDFRRTCLELINHCAQLDAQQSIR